MKIVICGYFGIRNIGDEAILEGLKAMFLRIFPGCEIEVMGKGRLFPFGFRSFLRSLFSPKLWTAPYRLIKSCDLFILTGGLFTDEEGFFVPTFWALHGLIAHHLKKPIYILGVNIGELNLWNTFLCKKLFSKSRLSIVRDQTSYNLLASWGIKSCMAPDFATMIPFRPVRTEEKNRYIVLSAKPIKQDPNSLYTNLAQFCDSVSMEYGLQIRLIPFHEGDMSDASALNKIFEQMKNKSNAKIEKFYEKTSDLLPILANAEVVIAMRLHAGILSVMSETPFIALPSMKKVENLWSEFPGINIVEITPFLIDKLELVFQNIINSRRDHRAIVSAIKQKFIERATVSEELIKSAL